MFKGMAGIGMGSLLPNTSDAVNGSGVRMLDSDVVVCCDVMALWLTDVVELEFVVNCLVV